jgi:hypothetical protein
VASARVPEDAQMARAHPRMRLMARKVMFLLAFLAAFGQAVAIAAFPRAAADEIGHAFAHVQEPSHHHHDDGLMHVDETQESTFHVHVGDGASVALVSSAVVRLPAPAPQGPPQQVRLSLPAPLLDGLLRPPRQVG